MAQRQTNFSGGQVTAPNLSGVNQSLGNIGSLLGQYQEQEQQKIVNARAAQAREDKLLQQGIENKIRKSQNDRAVVAANQKTTLFDQGQKQLLDEEAIAKTVLGVDKYGKAPLVTPGVTQADVNKVVASNKLLNQEQVTAGNNYQKSFDRNMAELQEINKQVGPITQPAPSSKYRKGSMLDSISNWWDGNPGTTPSQPVITPMSKAEMEQQAGELALQESGVLGLQGTANVPTKQEAVYGDKPLLSNTVHKQAQIDAVLANPSIPSKMKAEYILQQNKPKSVDQQTIDLKKEVEAVKFKENFYKNSGYKNKTGNSALKDIRKIAQYSGNPESFMQNVKLLKSSGKSYNAILNRAVEKGGSTDSELMGTPWYDITDWGSKDINLK